MAKVVWDKKHIYGLVDPRNNQLRYIGQTIGNLNTRYIRHLYNGRHNPKTHLNCWINNLLKNDLKPEIITIENPEKDLDFWEIFYISYFRSIGCNLTNISKGGVFRGGFKHTEEHKLKMHNIFVGRKPWNTGLKMTEKQLENKVTGNRNSWKNTKTSSKYTGVSFDKKRNRWSSYIYFNGKLKNLGRFKSEDDAHNARLMAENKFLKNESNT